MGSRGGDPVRGRLALGPHVGGAAGHRALRPSLSTERAGLKLRAAASVAEEPLEPRPLRARWKDLPAAALGRGLPSLSDLLGPSLCLVSIIWALEKQYLPP